MPKNLKQIFKGKNDYLIVFIVIVVVALIVFSSFSKKEDMVSSTNTEKYVINLENKIKKSIAKLKGVKEVTVAINVDSGIKTVIAEDVKTVEDNGKITTTNTPIIVGGKPIVLGERYPQIVGVVVVCRSAENINVRMAILDTVTTILNVPCEKVIILNQ